MDSNTKTILALFLFVLLFIVFNSVEYGLLNQAGNLYFQSLIFSATTIVSIFKGKLKRKLYLAAFLLLFLTAIIYFLGNIAIANAVASIGIGMLLIVSLSYLPQLIKKGYIESL